MSLRGQILVVAISVLVVLYVINAVRRRKLNEEYCLWWIFIMAATDVLVLNQRVLAFVTHAVGALVPISTLTLFALLLVLAMLVYFSMKISVLSNQVKELAQAAALQKKDSDDLRACVEEQGK